MSAPTSKDSKDGKGDGEDLNSVLDESQRADVALLIANCTESMRTILLQNFDAKAGLDKSLMPANKSDEEKFMSTDPSTADVEAYDKERKLQAECEKDINTSAAQKLKKSALKAYDEWREQVLMRVGEAVNTKSDAKSHLDQTAEDGPKSPRPKAPATTTNKTLQTNSSPNIKFKDLFPPTKSPLTKLPMNQRTLILHSLLLLLLSLEHYNAYSRILMLNLTSSLKLGLRTFEQDEYTTAVGLLESARELSAYEHQQGSEQQQATDAADLERTKRNRWLAATAAGAAILGVSGGLAAPLISSGVGSVMGGLGLGATAAAGYLGSVAGSTLLVGGIFGAYGGRMTGQMMEKYAREVEDFEFLGVHGENTASKGAPSRAEGEGDADNDDDDDNDKEAADASSDEDHKLRVTICISGWLTSKSEVTSPWRVLGTGAEVFALKYELEALLNLGHAMDGMLQSAAWGYAQREIVKRTIFADLMAAFWPMGLIKVARVIDNPFSVAKARADKAGVVLADALVNRAQGERPVTLIGYSLGARVIYTCLKALAERRAFGLVENAVLIGGPCPSDTKDWRVLRTAVAGRLVNVYSRNDYLLGFMYRTSALQYGVAGLQPIRGLAGVENVDVSEDVDGHTRYRFLIGGILKKIGFEDIDLDAVKEEQEALEKMLKQEKKNSLQSQRKRLMRRESYKTEDGKVDEDEEAEVEASDMEKQVQDKTQKSLMARMMDWWYTPKAGNAADAEKVGKTLQQAINNPADAKAALGDTYTDGKEAAQSYASYIASKLPSMPGGSSSESKTKTEKVTTDAKKTAEDATATTTGYIGSAKEYLPNMPAMPAIPSFRSKPDSKSNKDTKTETATEKASSAAKTAADTTQKGATAAAGITKDVVQPTVNNVLNPKDNPAVKAAQDTAKNSPTVQKAADSIPGAKKAAQVTQDTVGVTVQNTADTARKAVNEGASKGADAATGTTKAAAGGMKRSVSFGKDVVGGGTEQASKATDVGKGAGKAASDVASKVVGGGTEQAGKTVDAGKGAGKAASDVAGKVVAGGTEQASKTADVGKGAGKAASDGVAKLAKAGQDTASTAGAQASKAADTGSGLTKAASSGANQAADAGKGAADALASSGGKATDASKSAAEGITSGLGKAASSGQEALKSPSTAPSQASKAGQTATNAAASGASSLFSAGKSLLGQSKQASQPSTPSAAANDVKSPQTASTPSKEAGKSPKSPKTSSTPQTQQQKSQSYFAMASSYMPSLPSTGSAKKPSAASTPQKTAPNNATTEADTPPANPPSANKAPSSGKRAPPKLGAKRASQPSSTTPKQSSTPKQSTTPQTLSQTPASPRPKSASRTPSSSIQSPPPKLNRLPSAGASSTSSKTPSGVKSPPPKLGQKKKQNSSDSSSPGQQQPGAVAAKSPPPKLQSRQASGLKPVTTTTTTSKSSSTESSTKKQAAGGGSWTSAATNAASGAVGGLTGRLPGFGGGAKTK